MEEFELRENGVEPQLEKDEPALDLVRRGLPALAVQPTQDSLGSAPSARAAPWSRKRSIAICAAGRRLAAKTIGSESTNGFTRASRASNARASWSSIQWAYELAFMAVQIPYRMILLPRRIQRPLCPVGKGEWRLRLHSRLADDSNPGACVFAAATAAASAALLGSDPGGADAKFLTASPAKLTITPRYLELPSSPLSPSSSSPKALPAADAASPPSFAPRCSSKVAADC